MGEITYLYQALTGMILLACLVLLNMHMCSIRLIDIIVLSENNDCVVFEAVYKGVFSFKRKLWINKELYYKNRVHHYGTDRTIMDTRSIKAMSHLKGIASLTNKAWFMKEEI